MARYDVPVFKLVDVHSDIDVRNKESAAQALNLIPVRIGIDATEDNVTIAERDPFLLPLSRQTQYLGFGVDAFYQPARDCRFTCSYLRISVCRSNQAVQIGILHLIVVADNKMTDSKMCQLLCDMGTAAA